MTFKVFKIKERTLKGEIISDFLGEVDLPCFPSLYDVYKQNVKKNMNKAVKKQEPYREGKLVFKSKTYKIDSIFIKENGDRVINVR